MVVKLVDSEGAEMALDFELGSSVYCKAKVADVTSVSLWLGAGVMVEYPLDEAKVRGSTNKGKEPIRHHFGRICFRLAINICPVCRSSLRPT